MIEIIVIGLFFIAFCIGMQTKIFYYRNIIKNMKCCGNCKYQYTQDLLFWDDDQEFPCEGKESKCDKWELNK